ncbi:MAG: isochorismatase family protein [Planctomycetes bacterium]|nr:isochorismatase family protein [Planctomycetota bacterium]
MPRVARIDAKKAQLLVVDVQEKLLPHIADHESVTSQSVRIIRAARELELPITLTEQYPNGLGHTAPAVTDAAEGANPLEKMAFSVWQDVACRERLLRPRRPQVLLVGIEAHVCVQRTALDLLEAELTPFVLADAVGSRRHFDRDVALDRLRAAGVGVTTVESAIFEMLDRAGTELFKRILPIVR